MALKGLYPSPDEAPEPLREHLVEKDGKWLLDVEGYVTKDTLDSFRTNNRALNRERDQLKKDMETMQAQLSEVQERYKGIDPDEYKSLKAGPSDTQRQIAEATALLKTQIQTEKAQIQAEIQAEREARKQAEHKLNMEKIKMEVVKLAPKYGVRPTSLHNLLRDAADVFDIIDDQPVPLSKGEPRYSEKTPSKLMDVDEWIGLQVPINPDYFASSSGGGVNGGITGRSLNGRPVIPASDSRAFLARLEDIATGKVEVDLSA